jgi:hypothetical protein
VGNSPIFWTPGASVTLDIVFGSTTAQVVVASQ